MSLSPVPGADAPETLNGIATPPPSVNGPHSPAQVKLIRGRAPPGGAGPEEALNNMDAQRVHEVDGCSDGDGEDAETSDCLLQATHETNATPPPATPPPATLPLPTHTGESERSSKDSDTEKLQFAAIPGGSTEHTHSSEASWRGRRHESVKAEDGDEGGDGEREKQDEEDDEKNEKGWKRRHAGGRTARQHYSSSAPGPSTSSSSSSSPPPLLSSEEVPCPPHVMAQVWVRNVPEKERIVRGGMQDSKSLDEISHACGGSLGARAGGRGGQSEGRRATISSALELEGTVSHEGDLTNFITKNLEQKIKMSSKPSLDCSDSDCSGPIYRSRALSRRPADIPPIDPAVLLDLQRHTQEVAHGVETMMRSLNGTIQNMTALSVGYIQTYRDSVDSLGESVDMSIKGMYTLMARCEELDRSMQPIHTLATQIRDIKRTLDALEAVCK